jgi:hypothetical protein
MFNLFQCKYIPEVGSKNQKVSSSFRPTLKKGGVRKIQIGQMSSKIDITF